MEVDHVAQAGNVTHTNVMYHGLNLTWYIGPDGITK